MRYGALIEALRDISFYMLSEGGADAALALKDSVAAAPPLAICDEFDVVDDAGPAEAKAKGITKDAPETVTDGLAVLDSPDPTTPAAMTMQATNSASASLWLQRAGGHWSIRGLMLMLAPHG